MQTRRKQITQCRATTLCKKKVLEHGCFCVDHELLWIARCGEPSIRIRTKHKKMYRQFQNQQDRAFVAADHERIDAMVRARRAKIDQQAERLHKMLATQTQQVLAGMKQLADSNLKDLAYTVGVPGDVHDAALYGLGEHAQAAADSGDDQPRADAGAEGGASSSDWRLSTSAYEPAGEGQSEVPAPDVHRSGK